MPIRIAVVGPGRLGRALARRWHEAGADFVGFLGRDLARTSDALAFVGAGEALAIDQLHRAHAVVLAVADDAVTTVAAELAARRAVRSCALCFHLAGALSSAVLQPLAERCGARIGALHPLVPVPDAEAGYRALDGRFALCEAGPRGMPLLARLARAAGLRPVQANGPIDRAAYHAACTLAANGVTALIATAARVLGAALGVDRSEAEALTADLGAAALDLCREHGTALALSGPVLRGDVERVEDHLRALRGQDEDAAMVYRALMRQALVLARERGLSGPVLARLAARLAVDTDA